MLLPRCCAVCLEVGTPLCRRCAGMLSRPRDAAAVPGLDACVALFAYEGAGRVLVGRLKYANHRDALEPVSGALAALIDRPVDLVTWVPTTARRRRRRGYDQAELVARAVARSLGTRATATLVRDGESAQRSQTGRHRAERLDVRFEPGRWAAMAVRGRVVAVVDDVRTSGGSLRAAATALRGAGAVEVVGATLAATPWGVPAAAVEPVRTLSFAGNDPLQSSSSSGTPSRPDRQGNRRSTCRST